MVAVYVLNVPEFRPIIDYARSRDDYSVTKLGDFYHKGAATSVRARLVPPRRVVLGVLFLAVMATVTVGLVAYVVVQSFDVAPLGYPYRFGLAGWHDIVASNRT